MNNESKECKSIRVEGGIGENYATIKFKSGRYVVDQYDGTRLLKLEEEEIVREIPHKDQKEIVCFEVEQNGKVGLLQIQKIWNQQINREDYNLISDGTKWHRGIITSKEARMIPIEYLKIDFPFGIFFPRVERILDKKQLKMVYNTKKGLPLTNTLAEEIKYYARRSQFICYIDGKAKVVSELNELIIETEYNIEAVRTADVYAGIFPSGYKYATKVWKYNANGKVGILYIENEEVKSYVLIEIPFEQSHQVLCINEYYMLLDGRKNSKRVPIQGETAKLYYKGKYVDTIECFKPKGITKYFLNTYQKYFVGKTAIQLKSYEMSYTVFMVECKDKSSNVKEITIQHGAVQEHYYLDITTGDAIKIR